MLRSRRLLGVAPASILAFAAHAVAQAPYNLVIVHVNTPGHATNVVPGTGGLAFNAGGASTSAFERPVYSSNGLHWGINALAETGTVTTNDDVLLVDGALVMREGSPTPWPSAGQNVGTINVAFGLNNAGDLLVGNNSSATTNDDYLALFQGGVWTVLAQEAGLVNAVLPGIVGGPAGTWDDVIDSPALSDTGIPVWRATGIDGLTTGTANDAVVVLGGGLALQKGVDVPANQAGAATNAWENFGVDDIHVSANGAVTMVQGDLLGATTSDGVVVVNGVVVVQEGVVLAGSTFVEPVDLSGILEAWVDRAGSWYVRGNNDLTETDWVYRNGVVVADSGGTSEVVSGSGEFWDDAEFADCFFAFDGNSLGHYLIGGVSNGPTDTNAVLVFADGAGYRTVVAREGDPIDLNGNGLFDDNRFFNTFGNDDALLLDDGTIVFTATLEDGTGAAVDQGVFRLTPKSASCTLRNGTGVNPIACTCTTLPVLGTIWTLNVAPGPQTLFTFLFASTTSFGPFPLFGELLIGPAVVEIPTALPLPASLSFLGMPLFVQGLRLDFNGVDLSLVLTNAQDAVLGL